MEQLAALGVEPRD
jgi:uncharacterized coiled-coil protein SlyX